ncbi:hypothetical protein TNCV_2100641 [Trichonephila clavipes]|nr:hypothetical protein TNCV_2100641 [Trichonephila clavipes]
MYGYPATNSLLFFLLWVAWWLEHRTPDRKAWFTYRNCGGGDRGRVTIYRPFGEFRRAKSHCHLYGAQGQRHATMFRGPRSDYVRQVESENNNNFFC